MQVVDTIERDGNSYRYVDDMKTPESRRTLDIPRPLAEILGAYLSRHQDEFVFPSPTGGFLRYHNWRSRFGFPRSSAPTSSP